MNFVAIARLRSSSQWPRCRWRRRLTSRCITSRQRYASARLPLLRGGGNVYDVKPRQSKNTLPTVLDATAQPAALSCTDSYQLTSGEGLEGGSSRSACCSVKMLPHLQSGASKTLDEQPTTVSGFVNVLQLLGAVIVGLWLLYVIIMHIISTAATPPPSSTNLTKLLGSSGPIFRQGDLSFAVAPTALAMLRQCFTMGVGAVRDRIVDPSAHSNDAYTSTWIRRFCTLLAKYGRTDQPTGRDGPQLVRSCSVAEVPSTLTAIVDSTLPHPGRPPPSPPSWTPSRREHCAKSTAKSIAALTATPPPSALTAASEAINAAAQPPTLATLKVSLFWRARARARAAWLSDINQSINQSACVSACVQTAMRLCACMRVRAVARVW